MTSQEKTLYTVSTYPTIYDLQKRATTGELAVMPGQSPAYVEVYPKLDAATADRVAEGLSDYLGGTAIAPVNKLSNVSFGTIFTTPPEVATIPIAARVLGLEVTENILPRLGIEADRQQGGVSDLAIDITDARDRVQQNPDWVPFQVTRAINNVREAHGLPPTQW